MDSIPTAIIWAATEPVEKDDLKGESGTVFLGYFEDENNAKEMVKGRGVFGGNGSVRETTVFLLDGEYYSTGDGKKIVVYKKDDQRIVDHWIPNLPALVRRLMGR